MKYHIAAFFGGFLLDLILGDPYRLPHPIRLLGRLIAKLEAGLIGKEEQDDRHKEQQKNRRNTKSAFKRGCFLVGIVLVITGLASTAILVGAYCINPYVGMAAEGIMTYQLLAAKCLKVESMKVYNSLKHEGLEAARKSVSMIVGRDTASLNEEGVTKAAIETVAENTSDGVIAPMLYTALGGPVLGFLYKAVNTMDSMVGYKNDRYLYFGKAAARLDDVVNYIPSRISAFFMIAASFLGGKQFHGRQAVKIYKRDRKKHASPNSAQTESVCAGALGIQLAGDASYFGKLVKKPYIGDALRKVEYEDIKRADHLMYLTAWLGELFCLVLMLVVTFILEGM